MDICWAPHKHNIGSGTTTLVGGEGGLFCASGQCIHLYTPQTLLTSTVASSLVDRCCCGFCCVLPPPAFDGRVFGHRPSNCLALQRQQQQYLVVVCRGLPFRGLYVRWKIRGLCCVHKYKIPNSRNRLCCCAGPKGRSTNRRMTTTTRSLDIIDHHTAAVREYSVAARNISICRDDDEPPPPTSTSSA